MAMVRKQVYLPAKLERDLKREAAKRGVAEAAVIRERLEHRCAQTPHVDDAEAKARFLKLLEKYRRRAEEYNGPKSTWKFDREEVYEERIERQMPR